MKIKFDVLVSTKNHNTEDSPKANGEASLFFPKLH